MTEHWKRRDRPDGVSTRNVTRLFLVGVIAAGQDCGEYDRPVKRDIDLAEFRQHDVTAVPCEYKHTRDAGGDDPRRSCCRHIRSRRDNGLHDQLRTVIGDLCQPCPSRQGL